jgi:hypothetical protein
VLWQANEESSEGVDNVGGYHGDNSIAVLANSRIRGAFSQYSILDLLSQLRAGMRVTLALKPD